MTELNLISLVGLFALSAVAWAAGGLRRPITWRPVIGSGLLMLALGAVVFLVPQTRYLLIVVNDFVIALLGASRAGAEFLFGPLALNPGEQTAAGEPSVGFILAAQVLPAVVFFAAIMEACYHLGLIQPVIRTFARVFKKTLQLSGVEALAGASNIFVGIEAALTIRPYLATMTRSELLTLLTCCMATVASTTLALYVFLLQGSFPQIAGHLLSASILSIPAAVLISKLILPETEVPVTLGALPPLENSQRHGNTFAAFSAGAWDGLKLAAGIATLLIAVLGVVAILDLALGKLTAPLTGSLGRPLNVARILGWLFTPLVWLMGMDAGDLTRAAQLLGQRAILTEVVAYRQLGAMAAAQTVTPRTLLILSYALCGFAHVSSMGIFVGGISALAPSRRDDLTALAFRALAGATLATLMTGALAGLYYHGQQSLLGL
jgi:concentrative nucleoside transporter, CNT family